MTEDCGQPSDVGEVPKCTDCRVEHLPSVILGGFKYDRERLIKKGTAGPVTELGQNVEAQDPFLQIA